MVVVKKGSSLMKKHLIRNLCCGLCTLMLPMTVALAAEKTNTAPVQKQTATAAATTLPKTGVNTTATSQGKTAISVPNTKEPVVTLPKTLQWTQAGTNSQLIVYFDEKNLQYNKKTGIITTWTKWEYKSAPPKAAKAIYLLSQYDIRLKTYTNLKQLNASATGEALSYHTYAVPTWQTISKGTLGEDICTALNNYFMTH